MKTFAALLIVSCAFLSVKVEGHPQGQDQQLPAPKQGPLPGPNQGPFPGPNPGPFPRPPSPFAPFSNFTNQGLNEIVNGIIFQMMSIKSQISNRGLNTQMVAFHIKKLFNIYSRAVESAGSCATDEMKALPDQALADVLSCIPSDEDLQQKKEEAKQKFDALLAQLKIADDEIFAITDELQKQVKTAETQWELAVPFINDITENMYTELTKVHQCMNNVRTKVQEQVTANLGLLESCPQQ